MWTQNNTNEEALNLPLGNYAANFGFYVQQTVRAKQTIEAANFLKENNIECKVHSQAEIIVLAAKKGCFSHWATNDLILC